MTIEEAQRSYQALRQKLQSGQITPQAFSDQVNRLRLQDSSGRWWQIDPQNGQWLGWDGSSWVPAQTTASAPPQRAAPPQRGRTQPSASAPHRVPRPSQGQVAPSTRKTRQGSNVPLAERPQGWWNRMSILGGAAGGGLWLLWSSFRAGTEGGVELISPLLMVLMPVVLTTLRKPIDRLLWPLHKLRERVPRMVLVGAGLAAPLVVSSFLYGELNLSNFPFLRWSVVLGTLASYLIVRTPQAPGSSTGPGGGPA